MSGGGALNFGSAAARQELPRPARPDALDRAGEDLARVAIERDLDGLSALDVLEDLLVVAREHVAVGVADEGGDRAEADDARHHARTDLEVDDVAVLGRHQGGVLEIVSRLIEFGLHAGHGRVHAADLGLVAEPGPLELGSRLTRVG